MDLELPINFKNINFNIFSIAFGIYLLAIGVLYYFIFHKHHKKNKIQFDELITLVTKFYTVTMLTTIGIILGIVCIIYANTFKYDRAQVISAILLGIIIITISIINYVFYIKRSLKEMDVVERESIRKATIKIGEIIELIFFIIFILMPIWRIPKFIEVIENKKQLIIELVRSFGLCIAALFLMDSLNPVNIKEKIKNLFTKKKDKKIK